ncbi:MAG: peptidylprolyl isomerase [Verrucomicrobiota bacterium]
MKILTSFFSLFLFVSCLKAEEKQETSTEAETQTKAEQPQSGPHPGLKDPSKAAEKAPDTFKALFTTTEGEVEITVTRKWSPQGADRFYNLVKIGYFKDVAFFRVVNGFMAQFGIHGDSSINTAWRGATIKDDPNAGISNTPGKITFAKTGLPNSRSVQFFINYGNNDFLDNQGFTPFGEVTKGMDVVSKLYNGYGERTTQLQGQIMAKGNDFLKSNFPELDYIKSATIVE